MANEKKPQQSSIDKLKKFELKGLSNVVGGSVTGYNCVTVGEQCYQADSDWNDGSGGYLIGATSCGCPC